MMNEIKPNYYDFDVDGEQKDLFALSDELFKGLSPKAVFALGNAFKYIRRAGHKDNKKTMQDLQKALACIKAYANGESK